MRDSRLKAQLSISGVLTNWYRGTVGRGEQRNFRQSEFSQLGSWVASVLSPACIITWFLPSTRSSTADTLEGDVQAALSLVLHESLTLAHVLVVRTIPWLIKQELQVLMSVKCF